MFFCIYIDIMMEDNNIYKLNVDVKIMSERNSYIELPDRLLNHELRPNASLLKEIPKHTVIVTTTMYPTNDGNWNVVAKTRANLALQMFKKARGFGYDVVCIDCKSDDGWREEARNSGVQLINEDSNCCSGEHPMGIGRRQGFYAARALGDYKIFAWTEPEKHPFILSADGESPVAMTSALIYEGRADAVIPRRMDLSFYPDTQQTAEYTANLIAMKELAAILEKRGSDSDLINKVRTKYLDYCTGSRAFSRKSIDYVTDYPGDINGKEHDRWEAILVPVWNMIFDKKRVEGVAVPYEHPPEQTAIENTDVRYDEKRIEQLGAFVGALRDLREACSPSHP
jgi:hypothetical protein